MSGQRCGDSNPAVRRSFASTIAPGFALADFQRLTGRCFLRQSLPLACIIAAVAACAPLEQRAPAEAKVIYRDVPTDRPVPCFTEAERPIPKPLTPIDLDNATVDQMAAAIAADDANEALFMKAVEALFLKCQAAAGKLVPELQPPKGKP